MTVLMSRKPEAIYWVNNSGDADVALSVTELAWMRDGIEELEVKTIEELSYIGQRDSGIASSVVSLPWVQDSIEELDFETIVDLRYYYYDDSDVVATVVALDWCRTV